jgi:hypothetical protein
MLIVTADVEVKMCAEFLHSSSTVQRYCFLMNTLRVYPIAGLGITDFPLTTGLPTLRPNQ